MRAEQVGIRVDHLRFEPQAELHAFSVHVIGERLEALRPVRPHILRYLPVAEPGCGVSAGAEPAVIHHEPFDTGIPGLIGQSLQRVVVMVEIHGLPRVENHRTRLDGEIRVTGAHVIMESRSHLVEPVTVRPVQPRGGVRFTAGERGLAAEQHLAAANQTGRIRLTLCRQHGIAAPAHMHRIDLAMLEPEAGLARGKQQRGVKTWAPRHRDLLEASFGQRLPLRAAFAQMMAGGGEYLRGKCREREAEFDFTDFQVTGRKITGWKITQRGALSDQSAGQQFGRP